MLLRMASSRLRTLAPAAARGVASCTLAPAAAQGVASCTLSPECSSLLDEGAVNFHFSRRCNYACAFCFHSQSNIDILPIEKLLQVVSLLADAGVRKLNFAGGEPFLFPVQLSKLLAHAKDLGLYTSIITNGSHLTGKWMRAHAQHIDMLGYSFDSASDKTNFAHGRWPKGARDSSPADFSSSAPPSRSVRHLLHAAELAREHGVMFKVNSVVTALNWKEDISAHIEAAQPKRWKVFQVLPLEGENCGSGGRGDVLPLLLPREHYFAFVERNRAGLRDPSVLIAEPNDVMQSSYVVLDEAARFLDSSSGGKVPTESILDVGVERAAAQLLRGAGGGHDKAAYYARGGDFYLGADSKDDGSKAPPDVEEVEIKFAVPAHLRAACCALGSPAETLFTDTYFDCLDAFTLTTRDMWLRQRDATIELKMPSSARRGVDAAHEAESGGELRVDLYTEATSWPSIAASLKGVGVSLPPSFPVAASPSGAVAPWLALSGLLPFATIRTSRSRFALTVRGHRVHVDLDAVCFEGGREAVRGQAAKYAVGEVELLEAAGGKGARAALAEVLNELRILTPAQGAPHVRGKVLEFLHRFDRVHWRALGASGLLTAKLGPGADID
ncbi:hypothetical protein T492DRAFT_903746 [Pavlovales sp. CCMP2436]|nr:hypothetical protein T492DRAFT_903746 [Pavlovales sp. CCMP2436]|mmetsp:Transcript_11260/g.29475  ORF Transcript_11260/g.29475 Transcript_11260/m.29475 type:complete len:613 (+) Transcript_11260:35-1873(+)